MSKVETLLAVAEEYRGKGYQVTVEPKPAELPPFLSTFTPDLLAVSGEEKVVIAVKRRPEVRGDTQFVKLATAVEEHSGWRFEVVFVGP